MKPISLEEYRSLSYRGTNLSDESRQIDKMLESFINSKDLIAEVDGNDINTFDLSSSLSARLAANKISNRIRAKQK